MRTKQKTMDINWVKFIKWTRKRVVTNSFDERGLRRDPDGFQVSENMATLCTEDNFWLWFSLYGDEKPKKTLYK